MSAALPRIEVVHSDADKPWHGRIWSNSRLIWSTPQHTRMVGVERALLTAVRVFGWYGLHLKWNVPGVEKVFVRTNGSVPIGLTTVHYIDERLHKVARPPLPSPGSLNV